MSPASEEEEDLTPDTGCTVSCIDRQFLSRKVKHAKMYFFKAPLRDRPPEVQ